LIVIRNEQLEALKYPQLLKFVRNVCLQIKSQSKLIVPNQTDKELEKNIFSSISKAQKKYGLISQSDCTSFVNISVEFGWDFDENPENEWMKMILQDPDITNPSSRLSLLID
jgi:hypothetical protein